MKNVQLGMNRLAVPAASVALALAGAIACSTESSTTPERLLAPRAAFDLNSDLSAGSLKVCKSGTAASFAVTFGGNFVSSEVTGGIVHTTGNNYTFSLTAGECRIIYSRSVVGGVFNDPEVTATVVEDAPSGGITFGSVAATTESATGSSANQAARSGTVAFNMFHDAQVNFVNNPAPPSSGCTVTLGWYKNHTSWPAGPLTQSTPFDGGPSLLTILNTQPKGSAYIILAHQYITALLNIQGGASVPPAVQTALNTAASYFAGGGPGAGDSSVDITGVSTVLDNYNNGLVGPGHCAD